MKLSECRVIFASICCTRDLNSRTNNGRLFQFEQGQNMRPHALAQKQQQIRTAQSEQIKEDNVPIHESIKTKYICVIGNVENGHCCKDTGQYAECVGGRQENSNKCQSRFISLHNLVVLSGRNTFVVFAQEHHSENVR
jgi:hypothetical protein